MSLKPKPHTEVPANTAQLAHQIYHEQSNRYVLLRDKLGALFADEDFASLFKSPQGRPAEAPAVVALVVLLQFMEDLSDAEAAHMVSSRIDWKYFLGLELEDAGFDASVLCEFRGRVLAGALEQLFLQRLLAVAQVEGLLNHYDQQRSDATHVIARVRELNRLECVGETLYHALNTLATVVPNWLLTWVPAAWATRYGQSFENYRLPRQRQARRELAVTIGQDGQYLLQTCYAAAAPAWLRELPAVETLRQVWIQQYYVQDEVLRWRPADYLPPHSALICSPYEVEARYATKRDLHWTGYKVHLTETCGPEAVHLITAVQTTLSTTADSAVTPLIHENLAAQHLLPQEHYVDTGYVDAQLVLDSAQDFAVALMGPLPPDTSWQKRSPTGFDRSVFTIDWDAQQVQCPLGVTSSCWSRAEHPDYEHVIHVRFPRAACQACTARARCTHTQKDGRTLTFLPQPLWEVQQTRRQEQKTPAFRAKYKVRAGVEGTISQGVRAFGLRHARYRGLAKTHLQHICTAVAMNLARLADWLQERQPAKTRRSRFARLLAAPT
jgi:transposase